MDFAAPHAGFVIASYALTLAVLVVMVAIYVGQARRRQKRLAELEEQGAPRRRRSGSDE
jgi:heme exporter protein CcmD